MNLQSVKAKFFPNICEDDMEKIAGDLNRLRDVLWAVDADAPVYVSIVWERVHLGHQHDREFPVKVRVLYGPDLQDQGTGESFLYDNEMSALHGALFQRVQ